MIPPEETNSTYTPDEQFIMHNKEEEAELLALINAHNQSMNDAVDNFNQQMERWRTVKDIITKGKFKATTLKI